MSGSIDVTTDVERSVVEERDGVNDRLAELSEDYETARRVARYVESGHDAPASVGDFLTVVRLDEDLALELRDSMGRTVIAAGADGGGEVRYAVWEHSALSGRQVTAWEYRRDVSKTLEDRQPRLRLREETPLTDVEAPSEFSRRGNGRVYRGP